MVDKVKLEMDRLVGLIEKESNSVKLNEHVNHYNYLDLRTRMQGCRACGLRVQASRVVPVSGKVGGVSVAFLGEGPGKNEDEEGLPFVGVSGRVLRAMVERCGIRNTAYFNVVGCRPWLWVEGGDAGRKQQDRAPSEGEKQACRGWLEEQIGLVDPYLIVALGVTAGKVLRPGTAMGTDRGKVFRIGKENPGSGRLGMVTWHPGATLFYRDKDGIRREQLEEDVKFAAGIGYVREHLGGEVVDMSFKEECRAMVREKEAKAGI